MSEAKKSWVNVRMTATERSKLNATAKAKGVTAAELIRRGLVSQGVNL